MQFSFTQEQFFKKLFLGLMLGCQGECIAKPDFVTLSQNVCSPRIYKKQERS